jgi:hypothetical protein
MNVNKQALKREILSAWHCGMNNVAVFTSDDFRATRGPLMNCKFNIPVEEWDSEFINSDQFDDFIEEQVREMQS